MKHPDIKSASHICEPDFVYRYLSFDSTGLDFKIYLYATVRGQIGWDLHATALSRIQTVPVRALIRLLNYAAHVVHICRELVHSRTRAGVKLVPAVHAFIGAFKIPGERLQRCTDRNRIKCVGNLLYTEAVKYAGFDCLDQRTACGALVL